MIFYLLTKFIKEPKSFSFSFRNSSSQTISEVRDSVLEAQIFRSLSPDSALAILSIDNKSRDDTLKLSPIFLSEKNPKADFCHYFYSYS